MPCLCVCACVLQTFAAATNEPRECVGVWLHTRLVYRTRRQNLQCCNHSMTLLRRQCLYSGGGEFAAISVDSLATWHPVAFERKQPNRKRAIQPMRRNGSAIAPCPQVATLPRRSSCCHIHQSPFPHNTFFPGNQTSPSAKRLMGLAEFDAHCIVLRSNSAKTTSLGVLRDLVAWKSAAAKQDDQSTRRRDDRQSSRRRLRGAAVAKCAELPSRASG